MLFRRLSVRLSSSLCVCLSLFVRFYLSVSQPVSKSVSKSVCLSVSCVTVCGMLLLSVSHLSSSIDRQMQIRSQCTAMQYKGRQGMTEGSVIVIVIVSVIVVVILVGVQYCYWCSLLLSSLSSHTVIKVAMSILTLPYFILFKLTLFCFRSLYFVLLILSLLYIVLHFTLITHMLKTISQLFLFLFYRVPLYYLILIILRNIHIFYFLFSFLFSILFSHSFIFGFKIRFFVFSIEDYNCIPIKHDLRQDCIFTLFSGCFVLSFLDNYLK